MHPIIIIIIISGGSGDGGSSSSMQGIYDHMPDTYMFIKYTGCPRSQGHYFGI